MDWVVLHDIKKACKHTRKTNKVTTITNIVNLVYIQKAADYYTKCLCIYNNVVVAYTQINDSLKMHIRKSNCWGLILECNLQIFFFIDIHKKLSNNHIYFLLQLHHSYGGSFGLYMLDRIHKNEIRCLFWRASFIFVIQLIICIQKKNLFSSE